jgi:hypothetical protein
VTGTHISHVPVGSGHYHQYQSSRRQAWCSRAMQVLHMFSGAQLPRETETGTIQFSIYHFNVNHISVVCLNINIPSMYINSLCQHKSSEINHTHVVK